MKQIQIPCDERERLNAAYQTALQDARELEFRLPEELVSSDLNVKRRAKSDLERAKRRPSHLLEELLAHEKKHGCVGR